MFEPQCCVDQGALRCTCSGFACPNVHKDSRSQCSEHKGAPLPAVFDWFVLGKEVRSLSFIFVYSSRYAGSRLLDRGMYADTELPAAVGVRVEERVLCVSNDPKVKSSPLPKLSVQALMNTPGEDPYYSSPEYRTAALAATLQTTSNFVDLYTDLGCGACAFPIPMNPRQQDTEFADSVANKFSLCVLSLALIFNHQKCFGDTHGR